MSIYFLVDTFWKTQKVEKKIATQFRAWVILLKEIRLNLKSSTYKTLSIVTVGENSTEPMWLIV